MRMYMGILFLCVLAIIIINFTGTKNQTKHGNYDEMVEQYPGYFK